MQVSHSPKETQQQQQQPPGNAPAPAPFTPTTPARNWLAISNLTQPLSASPPVIPPSLPSASLPDVSMPDQMPVEPAPVIDSPQSQRFAPPSTASPQTSSLHSLRLPEDPQEANEVTFFLRQYCEGLGRRYFFHSDLTVHVSHMLTPLTLQHRYVRSRPVFWQIDDGKAERSYQVRRLCCRCKTTGSHEGPQLTCSTYGRPSSCHDCSHSPWPRLLVVWCQILW